MLSINLGRLAQSTVHSLQSWKHLTCVRRQSINACPTGSVGSRLKSTSAASVPFSEQRLDQQTLPRLPLPSLTQTLDKYLSTVQPLVTSEEFEQTKQLVNEFKAPGSVGEKLQEFLVQREKNADNWLADWWLQNTYLAFRYPVIIYSSPCMVMPQLNYTGPRDRVTAAAKIIVATLDYKRMVDEGRLPLEKMGNNPLDMSQHSFILGTCRIPGTEIDDLVYAPASNPPRHIIVAHNNNFYKLDVYGKDGLPLGLDTLISALEDILKRSEASGLARPVGVLTTEHRDVWGKVYREIRKNGKNAETLAEIQKSLFLVCFDGTYPRPSGNSDDVYGVTAEQLIHGGGVQANSGNRWYDKTIQFVLGTNGEVGIAYEHSPAEGPPIASLSDHVMDYLLDKKKSDRSSSSTTVVPPTEVKFDVSPEVENAIDAASKTLDGLVKDLEMANFNFKSFGKNFIKTQKLSPDSFVQMALQLAFYRLHGVPGATYETASTRQYLQGRTETIRSASSESLKFCQAMLEREASVNEKRQSLENAINSHKKYVSEAVKGYGVDRHLLGLKLAAIDSGIEIPKLFKDKGFVTSTHFRISTSQVAARHRSFMAFGPLYPDGYGCCYNVREDDVIFGLSSFVSNADTSVQRFSDAIGQSMNDMRDLLLLATQKSKL